MSQQAAQVIVLDIRCECGRYLGERRTTDGKVVPMVDTHCRCGRTNPALFITPIIQELVR